MNGKKNEMIAIDAFLGKRGELLRPLDLMNGNWINSALGLTPKFPRHSWT